MGGFAPGGSLGQLLPLTIGFLTGKSPIFYDAIGIRSSSLNIKR